MNQILGYFIKSLAYSTLSLKKKNLLIGKPWVLGDNDGEIQKLIFKQNKDLVMSKNGVVTMGSWDYYPEAKALLIDRLKDKLLLKEQFIDTNILILKIDGTDNDFFVLVNENTIPDYNISNISRYLNSLKCKELKIREIKLFNNNIIQIHDSINAGNSGQYINKTVEQIDSQFNCVDLLDGSYLTKNKKSTFYVKSRKIKSVTHNIKVELKNGKNVEIENGTSYVPDNINKKITLNGKTIENTRLIDIDDIVYEVVSSMIAVISVIEVYNLNNGSQIKIEQKDFLKISRGDKVVDSVPIFPLPDGKYKIIGKWKNLKIINNIIQ